MNEPFFSVVVAAYNAQDTIRSSVESALAQSDDDLELIIIDDGSTDQTLKIAIQLSCEDSRVHVVSQPNSGPASARNHGARMAKGKFVAFLDADDAWHCEKLTKHWAIHDGDAGLDASFAKVHFCPESNGEMVPGRTFSQIPVGNIEMADILVENTICTTSNFVVKRDIFQSLGGFKEDMRFAEDQEFFARLVGGGGKIRGIEEPLVQYRMSEDGLSCDFDAMLSGWLSFANDWLSGVELAQAEAIYCRYLTRRALRSGARIAVARAFARRGLSVHRASFLDGGMRSALTLGGVIVGAAMPASLRRTVFA